MCFYIRRRSLSNQQRRTEKRKENGRKENLGDLEEFLFSPARATPQTGEAGSTVREVRHPSESGRTELGWKPHQAHLHRQDEADAPRPSHQALCLTQGTHRSPAPLTRAPLFFYLRSAKQKNYTTYIRKNRSCESPALFTKEVCF